MGKFFSKYRREISVVGTAAIVTSVATVIIPATTAKVGTLVVTGTCLAIGFYAGKKITNIIDEYLLSSDKSLDKLIEQLN